MMMTLRRSARLAGRSAPVQPLPAPTRPPRSRAVHRWKSSTRHVCSGILWSLAVVVAVGLLRPRPPPFDVAPPCHLVDNPADLAPCALVPDLNIVFAHLTPDLSAGDGLRQPWHQLHFFPAELSEHHEHSDATFHAYLLGREAHERVQTHWLPPQLWQHQARMIECLAQQRQQSSWSAWLLSPPLWLQPRRPRCFHGEARWAFDSASTVIAEWLAESSGDRRSKAQEELVRWKQSIEVRRQINNNVGRIAGEEAADLDEQSKELNILRGRYAAWLVEGVRWACRAREYAHAAAIINAMQERALLAPTNGAKWPDLLKSVVDDSVETVLSVSDGALGRHGKCVVEHTREAFEYCLPLGLDIFFRGADGELVLVADGVAVGADWIPQICEHILDPIGRGCTTHHHIVWYAWHNLVDLSLDSLSMVSSSSSFTSNVTAPPHLRNCTSSFAVTQTAHWSRYLFPALTRTERAMEESKRHAVDFQSGLAVKLNPQAVSGRLRHLRPWMGLWRVGRGRWVEQSS